GVTADVLTLAERGVHPLVVVSAVVDQDSTAVRSIWPVPEDAFRASLGAAIADGHPRAVKVGLIPSAELGRALAEALGTLAREVPIVVDPVLSGGAGGATPMAAAAAYAPLLALARRRLVVVTPNAPELGVLLRCKPPTDEAAL